MKYSGFHRAIGILHTEHRATWPICLCNEIDARALVALRGKYRKAGQDPPSYTALVVKAIALGIAEVSKRYPEINSYLAGVPGLRRVHHFQEISAGVAIAREEDRQDQTIVAIVPAPQATALTDITRQLAEHATLPIKDLPYARNCHYLFRMPWPVQKLMLWIGGTFPSTRRKYRGTFTLTSVGKFGVDYQLTLPQASCLQFGFGSIRDRPVVRAGKLEVAETFFLTLSFDRRLMNGRPCALLMDVVREHLEHANFPDVLAALAPAAPASPAEPAGDRHVENRLTPQANPGLR